MSEQEEATSPGANSTDEALQPTRRKGKAGKKGATKSNVDSLFFRLLKTQQDNNQWKTQGNNFVWITDEEKAFTFAEIVSKDAETGEVTVQLEDGTKKVVSIKETQQMNPPNLQKVEDMARLSYLNEPSVLDTLTKRYEDDMIYTYSGLFLVAINPYKRLPIYTKEVIDMHKGKRKEDTPPHIFAIADVAYRQMLVNHTNQSMLITGESGAGKTENTKKVIQYLTSIASKGGMGKLEEQLIRTNPLLEAFGNAKTLRNNNSSRFGKFIQIDFSASGYIVGTNIQKYLLETTRVCAQNLDERNFHYFYQLCQNQDARQKFKLGEPSQFKYLAQSGCTHVPGLDDKKEFVETNTAMDIIGIKPEEKEQISAVCAAILHLGNIEFVKEGGAGKEGAVIKDKKPLEFASQFLGVEASRLFDSIVHPTIKAGGQTIKTHANPEQANANRDALVKSTYGRLFDYIVNRVNESLSSKEPMKNFIGVLDIAGFEIFDHNSFEQLCINYTNEKLQQFFNHHMFKKEQEEYMREKIDWDYIDFGLDLQGTIDIIEKPMGIMSLLDQQTVLQGSTSKSLTNVILTSCKPNGVNNVSSILKATRFSDIQFSLSHYAGEVAYNTTNWLNKNRDPVSEDMKLVMRQSKFKYIKKLFEMTPEEKAAQASGASRGTRFLTVSNQHRTQLKVLMQLLESTEPHFIRCIVPNSLQKPGIIDPFNVLHQLKCNGVLEGIRIVRKGYPGRIPFKDFEKRYNLLAKKSEIASEPSIKGKCKIILDTSKLVESKHYKIGVTKVFLKAGVEAMLEEIRERAISQIILAGQAAIRGYLGRCDYARVKAKIDYIRMIQKNWKIYYKLKSWPWWELYQRSRPEIERRLEEEERKKLKAALDRLKKEVEDEEKLIQTLTKLKNDLNDKIQQLNVQLGSQQSKQDLLIEKINELEKKVDNMETNLKISKENKRSLDEDRSRLATVIMQKEQDIRQKEDQIQKLTEEVRVTQRDSETTKKGLGDRDLKAAQADAKLKHLEEEIKNWRDKYNEEKSRVSGIEKQKNDTDDQIKEIKYILDVTNKHKGDLETKNRVLSDEIKTKRTTIGELTSKSNQLEEELNKLKLELQRKENDLKNRLKSIEDLTIENKKYNTELNTANGRLSDEVRRRQKSETDVRHVKGDIQDLSSQNNKLTEEIKSIEATLNKLRDDGNTQKDKMNEIADTNTQLESKISNLEATVRENTFKSNSERDMDKQNIAQLTQKLQDLVDDLKGQISQTSAQKNQFDTRFRNADKKIRELSREYSDAQKVSEDVNNRIKKLEVDISELNNKLAFEKRRGEEIDGEKRLVSNEIRNSQLIADKLKDDVQKEDQKYRKAQQEFNEAQERIAQLEYEKDDLIRSLESNDRSFRQLKADTDAAKVQVSQLQVEKEKLQNDLKNLTQKEAELEASIEELKNSQKQKTEEANELVADLEKVKSAKRSSQRKCGQVEAQLKVVEQKLEDTEKRNKDLLSKRENVEALLRNAETNYMTTKSNADDLKRKLKSLEQQISNAETDLSESQNNVNLLKNDKREINLKIEELEALRADSQIKIDSNNTQVKKLQTQLADLLSKLESEKQQRATLDVEMSKLKAEIERQKDALNQEAKKHQQLVDDMSAQLQGDESAFQNQQQSIQSEISEMKKELASLQSSAAIITNMIDVDAVEKLKREYEAQIAKLTAQRDDELNMCNDLESRSRQSDILLQDCRDRLEMEEKQRKKSEQQKRSLMEELDDLQTAADEADELRSELERIQNESKQNVIRMKSELEKLRTQRFTAEETYNSAKRENDQLRMEIERERMKDNSMSSRLKTQFQSELSDIEMLVKKTKKDKETYAKQIKKLERQNRELNNKLAQENQSKIDADNKFATKDREIQKLRADLEYNTKVSMRFESENNSLVSEVTKYKDICSKIEDEIASLRIQVQRQQKKNRMLSKRGRAASAKNYGFGDEEIDDDTELAF